MNIRRLRAGKHSAAPLLRWPFQVMVDLSGTVAEVIGPRGRRAVKFLLVGASGVVVNIAVMALVMMLGVHYLPASVIGTELSILWNLHLYERFVFRDRRGANGLRARIIKSVVYNNLEFALRVPFLIVAVSVGLNSVLAQFVSLVVAFVARFAFTSRVVYGARPETPVISSTVSAESENGGVVTS